jgi:GNAT superfamily N-acetyltransferase
MNLQIVRTRHPPEAYHEQLVALIHEYEQGISLADVRRRLEKMPNSDRLFLALDGEPLIGYAQLRVSHDLLAEDTVELLSIIVTAGARRKGVGRHLMTAAETWALQAGRARLRLHADVVQTEALAFFSALGYEQTMTAQQFTRDLESTRNAESPTQPSPR